MKAPILGRNLATYITISAVIFSCANPLAAKPGGKLIGGHNKDFMMKMARYASEVIDDFSVNATKKARVATKYAGKKTPKLMQDGVIISSTRIAREKSLKPKIRAHPVDITTEPPTARTFVQSTQEIYMPEYWLKSGTHRLIVTAAGYKSKTIDFDVSSNNKSIHIVLSKRTPQRCIPISNLITKYRNTDGSWANAHQALDNVTVAEAYHSLIEKFDNQEKLSSRVISTDKVNYSHRVIDNSHSDDFASISLQAIYYPTDSSSKVDQIRTEIGIEKLEDGSTFLTIDTHYSKGLKINENHIIKRFCNYVSAI